MSTLNYQPIGDRVIVEPDSAEQKTKSGIYLPDAAQEKPQSGCVLAVGQGRISDEGKAIPMSIKAGDNVIYSKYGGTELKINDKDYLIIRESDILAVKK
ncbi:co-chaperone GroES [Thermoproteota archaeon]